MVCDMGQIPTEEEQVPVRATANKSHREMTAGICFHTQVRSCIHHTYVRSLADDSIFAGTGLSAGDEVFAVVVPVSGMNAVELFDLVADSEGNVTINARRARRMSPASKQSPTHAQKQHTAGNQSKSARKLLSRLGRSIRRCESLEGDWECVTATAHKMYRSMDDGIVFRKNALKPYHDTLEGSSMEDDAGVADTELRMTVAHIEPDSVFTDLQIGDEVISVEVSVEGRTAQETADLVRMSEGIITILAEPKHPPTTVRNASCGLHALDTYGNAKAPHKQKRSILSFVSRSGMFQRCYSAAPATVTPTEITNTELTERSDNPATLTVVPEEDGVQTARLTTPNVERRTTVAGADAGSEEAERRVFRPSSGSIAVFCVSVPENIRPGDDFPVLAEGRVLTVRCPPRAYPGSSVQFTVLEENRAEDHRDHDQYTQRNCRQDMAQ